MNWLKKLQNFRVKSLACGLFALASASPSFADWTICNRTPEEVYASIAFDNGGGYVSSGWYRINGCGGCVVVYHGVPKLRGVFYYAHSRDRAQVWEGNTLFCTRPGVAFKFGSDLNSVRGACERQGFRMESFGMATMRTDNYTTNLTGRHPSGRVCID